MIRLKDRGKNRYGDRVWTAGRILVMRRDYDLPLRSHQYIAVVRPEGDDSLEGRHDGKDLPEVVREDRLADMRESLARDWCWGPRPGKGA